MPVSRPYGCGAGVGAFGRRLGEAKRLGEWAEAEALLRRLVEMLRSGEYERFAPFDPRLREDAPFNLGVCLVRRAALDEAEAVFEGLMGSARRGADAQRNLEAIRGLRARFGG